MKTEEIMYLTFDNLNEQHLPKIQAYEVVRPFRRC